MGTQEQINRLKREEEAELIAPACIFVLFVQGGAEWQGVIGNVTHDEQRKGSGTERQMSCSKGRGMLTPYVDFFLNINVYFFFIC